MRTLLCALLLVSVPTAAQAVYFEAEIVRKDTMSNGMKQWIVEFHGNAAGEQSVTRIYTPTDRTTDVTFGQWVQSHLNLLNSVKTIEDDPRFAEKQKVTPVPLGSPTRSDRAECYEKLNWYDKLAGKTFTGPLNGVVAKLKADLERVCTVEMFR